jgi:hypothetical protein
MPAEITLLIPILPDTMFYPLAMRGPAVPQIACTTCGPWDGWSSKRHGNREDAARLARVGTLEAVILFEIGVRVGDDRIEPFRGATMPIRESW